MAWKIVKAVTPQAGYWDLIGLFCKTPESEFNTSGHLHSLPNVIVEVERPCEANLPLSVGHFTQQRWDRFLKDYTDEKLPDFLKACLEARNSTEVGYSCPVSGRHAHGNCLIAASFEGYPKELTLYSRTSLIYPTGVLDMAFGAALARWLQPHFDHTIKLNWVIRSAVLHAKRSVTLFEGHKVWYMLHDPAPNKFTEQLRLHYDKLQADPDYLINSKFNPVKTAGKKIRYLQEGGSWEDIFPELDITLE